MNKLMFAALALCLGGCEAPVATGPSQMAAWSLNPQPGEVPHMQFPSECQDRAALAAEMKDVKIVRFDRTIKTEARFGLAFVSGDREKPVAVVAVRGDLEG